MMQRFGDTGKHMWEQCREELRMHLRCLVSKNPLNFARRDRQSEQ